MPSTTAPRKRRSNGNGEATPASNLQPPIAAKGNSYWQFLKVSPWWVWTGAYLLVGGFIALGLAFGFSRMTSRQKPLADLAAEEQLGGQPVTARQAFELAQAAAKSWQAQAVLVRVQSLDQVNRLGQSRRWQALFSTPDGKLHYQAEVVDGQLGKRDEVQDSATRGASLPTNWRDSDRAFQTLRQQQADFDEAKPASYLLYYSTDAKKWFWAITTDKGTTTIEAS